MCIAVFMWQNHPYYPFLLLLNRDEFHHRPTKPVAWWDGGDILGGRDEVGGGTWLACSRNGRIAFLTNVLELHTLPVSQTKSRGELPLRFFQSELSPKAFAKMLAKEGRQYNGFNLIVADHVSKTMFYVSNRPIGCPVLVQQVLPGIHVLSNGKLDSPWPKERVMMENTIAVEKMVTMLMRDTTKADKSKLPCICPTDWEMSLSSIFVQVDTPLGRYGTRSTAALHVSVSSEASFYETYLEDNQWKEKKVGFLIQ